MTNPVKTALISMPFASGSQPSIQLGLLGALAERARFDVDMLYLNLELAAELTPGVYERLCEHRGNLTSEWLFSVAAFGKGNVPDEESYLAAFPEEVERAEAIGRDAFFLTDLRSRILPAFIERCVRSTDWQQYDVIGFSSTFQQNVASLALARVLKRLHPSVIILFGGANVDGEMGVEHLRSFDFIDLVVSGEGDVAFIQTLERLAARHSLDDVPGLIRRTVDGSPVGVQAQPTIDLDRLPTPNYDPYFEQIGRLGLLASYQSTFALPFEASRGCWWGQKHHCTFCGLNGANMSYRAKSPDRVLSELSELTNTHGLNVFSAVDNILDYSRSSELFASIVEAKTDYELFFETKSNMSRQQIEGLYRGGVRRIQPGIESLSTNVLRLMRKGCTMLQNVRCLKWCLYYGIRVDWNLIWGFPGETRQDYEQELRVLRLIPHLEPPAASGRIWLERYSPYFESGDAFPIRNVRPTASYGHVYPQSVDLRKIAYFFDYEMDDTEPEEVHHATGKFLDQWRHEWEGPNRQTLTYRRTPDRLFIDYKRGTSSAGTYPLSGPVADVYQRCVETMQSPRSLAKELTTDGHDFSESELRDVLDEFCEVGLMLGDGDQYLSLAIPDNPNW